MVEYEVLGPGGHARLVSDIKAYVNRADGVGTTQLADESVTMGKLGEDVTDELDGIVHDGDPLNGNVLIGSIAEGAVLTADDAFAAPPMGAEVYGVSTQAVTTGKNLLSDQEDDWEKRTIPSVSTRWVYFIPVEEGASYTYSRNNTGSYGLILAWCEDTDFTDWTEIITLTYYQQHTVTNTTHAYLAVSLNAGGASSAAVLVSDIQQRECQIEKASAKTAYEPYSGGAASPSPDYPQEIKNVDNLAVVLAGKNLCGGSALLFNVQTAMPTATTGSDTDGNYVRYTGAMATSDGKTIATGMFKANTQYTVILKYANESAGTITQVRVVYTDGTVAAIEKAGVAANTVTTVVYTTAANKTVKSLQAVWVTGTTRLYYEDCGIFEGILTADQYEPYVGASVSIPLDDHSLRSLPNGTRDELHLAYLRPSTREGWAWYSKTLVQNVDTYVFPDTFSFNTTPTDLGDSWYRYVKYNTVQNVASNASGLCDRMRYQPAGTIKNEHVYLSGAAVLMVTQMASYVDASNALIGGTLQFNCTPVTTDLGEVEFPVMPSEHATVWCDGGSAQPTLSMSYERDVTIVIEQLEAQIEEILTS